jgi:peptidoglycan hydrolase-like protein with peptidoglycan-binding domain
VSFRQLIRRRGILGTASGAVAVVITGGVFAAVSSGSSHESLASTANSHTVSGTKKSAPVKAVPPLRILSVTPSSDAKGVNGAAPIAVTFSEKLAANSALPTLYPKIDGTWSISGDTATFQPKAGYAEDTRVTLSIPGGKSGVEAAGVATAGITTTAATDAGLLAKSASYSFTTGSYSTLGLQELLTQLGYLPFTFTPSNATAPATSGEANATLSTAYDPPAGSFTFKSGYPWQLTSQWKAGQDNELDTGAVMAFEDNVGLTMDGIAGPDVWSNLLKAAEKNTQNPNGYTYVLVNQASPETAKVWHDGKLIQTTLVNTGIPGRSTDDGTFPVYSRFQVTQMTGTNPDGSKYNDTVYWVSYFNGGDALHYFPRGGYGYYQSLGCVEMPYDPAKYIWQYTTYGTLVTVEGPVS